MGVPGGRQIVPLDPNWIVKFQKTKPIPRIKIEFCWTGLKRILIYENRVGEAKKISPICKLHAAEWF